MKYLLYSSQFIISLVPPSVDKKCKSALLLIFFYDKRVYFLAAFLTQTVCLDDTTVKFEIWDTAGQERYHSLAPMYYRGAQAAIIVYDITNQVGYTWTIACYI